MRLLSWNVRAGGGGRRTGQLDAIGLVAPDVIALQEVTFASRETFVRALEAGGFHVLDSGDGAPAPNPIAPRQYVEVLASRCPLRALDQRRPLRWPEWFLSAVLEHPLGPIELHTAHVPPGRSNRWHKIDALEGIFATLTRGTRRGRRVFCGTLNTPRFEHVDGRVETWGHRPGRGDRWEQAERQVLEGLAAHDLRDVFRDLGRAVGQFTWFAGETGRRYDHVFASQAMRPMACSYLHELRTRGLSEHSAALVEFAI